MKYNTVLKKHYWPENTNQFNTLTIVDGYGDVNDVLEFFLVDKEFNENFFSFNNTFVLRIEINETLNNTKLKLKMAKYHTKKQLLLLESTVDKTFIFFWALENDETFFVLPLFERNTWETSQMIYDFLKVNIENDFSGKTNFILTFVSSL